MPKIVKKIYQPGLAGSLQYSYSESVTEPSQSDPSEQNGQTFLYCPQCAVEVSDPLTCGDCSAVICRRCGTPLESADELGMG
jgi:hypothetical protein